MWRSPGERADGAYSIVFDAVRRFRTFFAFRALDRSTRFVTVWWSWRPVYRIANCAYLAVENRGSRFPCSLGDISAFDPTCRPTFCESKLATYATRWSATRSRPTERERQRSNGRDAQRLAKARNVATDRSNARNFEPRGIYFGGYLSAIGSSSRGTSNAKLAAEHALTAAKTSLARGSVGAA